MLSKRNNGKEKTIENQDNGILAINGNGNSSSSSSDEESESESSKSSGKKSDSESSDEENEVVAGSSLPKKYAFLALSREEMTPAQRRWKWVKYELLPDDMKKFVRPPKNVKKKKEKAEDAEGEEAKAAKKKREVQETNVVIDDDRQIDFSKLENVEKIVNKYKNQ